MVVGIGLLPRQRVCSQHKFDERCFVCFVRFSARLSNIHGIQTPSKSSNELNTSSRTCFSTLRASGAARASDARHKRATIDRLAPKLQKRRLGLISHSEKRGDRGFSIHDSRTSGGLFDELRLKALIFINEIPRAAVDKKNLKKLRFLSTEFFILLDPLTDVLVDKSEDLSKRGENLSTES